jgi:hypothetical protein
MGVSSVVGEGDRVIDLSGGLALREVLLTSLGIVPALLQVGACFSTERAKIHAGSLVESVRLVLVIQIINGRDGTRIKFCRAIILARIRPVMSIEIVDPGLYASGG